jgi:membrane protein YdbS with pleckstrin-like domain
MIYIILLVFLFISIKILAKIYKTKKLLEVEKFSHILIPGFFASFLWLYITEDNTFSTLFSVFLTFVISIITFTLIIIIFKLSK